MNQDKDQLARSFGSVADAYASARPGYPAEAAAWLVGGHAGVGNEPRSVLELGAGSGQLTEHLTGQQLVATDPSHEMLLRLRERVPGVGPVAARAEQLPLPSRAFDLVVAAQSFHWFDHDVALPEIARVLRPDGHLALVWNIPDESTPWVRKLQRIVPRPVSHDQDTAPLFRTPYFGFVEEQRFRTWKSVTRQSLLDLVRSRSPFAVADEDTRARMLGDVAALYDDYDRGTSGMQMPFVTHCYRARVQRQDALPASAPPPESASRPAPSSTRADAPDPPAAPPEDDGTLLIDFR